MLKANPDDVEGHWVKGLLRPPTAAIIAGAMLLGPATAADADMNDKSRRGPAYSMTYPVVGRSSVVDTFGAPRSGGRSHAGQDVMAAKMQPLVAAVDGKVTRVTIPEPSYGYMLTITGDDGWHFNYIHINNDTPGTDDGKASLEDVYGPGIVEGARVRAGQLVAYVGDSGNAEDVAPQLHFEMVDPSGSVVNPMAALETAARLAQPVASVGEEDVPDAFPRIAGEDRIGTAVEASRVGWPAGSAAVVIATATEYAEALPAAVLAARDDAPLLLLGDHPDERVMAELRRLGAVRVTVVGSVDRSTDPLLVELGLEVERVGLERDAVGTATELARKFQRPAGVLLVNKDSFADGISAAAVGARSGQPILLTTRDWVPQATVDAWRALGQPPVTVFGGTNVVGDNVMRFFRAARVAGVDRYGTSLAAARRLRASTPGDRRLLLATGVAYPDALAAAPLARKIEAVTLLVDGSSSTVATSTGEWLRASGIPADGTRVLGGAAAVSRPAAAAIGRILA